MGTVRDPGVFWGEGIHDQGGGELGTCSRADFAIDLGYSPAFSFVASGYDSLACLALSGGPEFAARM